MAFWFYCEKCADIRSAPDWKAAMTRPCGSCGSVAPLPVLREVVTPLDTAGTWSVPPPWRFLRCRCCHWGVPIPAETTEYLVTCPRCWDRWWWVAPRPTTGLTAAQFDRVVMDATFRCDGQKSLSPEVLRAHVWDAARVQLRRVPSASELEGVETQVLLVRAERRQALVQVLAEPSSDEGRGGRGDGGYHRRHYHVEDCSPWQANAIRALEGDW